MRAFAVLIFAAFPTVATAQATFSRDSIGRIAPGSSTSEHLLTHNISASTWPRVSSTIRPAVILMAKLDFELLQDPIDVKKCRGTAAEVERELKKLPTVKGSDGSAINNIARVGIELLKSGTAVAKAADAGQAPPIDAINGLLKSRRELRFAATHLGFEVLELEIEKTKKAAK